MTTVKDQESCGACWAFTSTAATEASVAMNTGIVESLSAQELIDCDKRNDQGCVGGNPAFAFGFIVRNGLASEERYPYFGEDTGVCLLDDPAAESLLQMEGLQKPKPVSTSAVCLS